MAFKPFTKKEDKTTNKPAAAAKKGTKKTTATKKPMTKKTGSRGC